jgi:hypothetical protein
MLVSALASAALAAPSWEPIDPPAAAENAELHDVAIDADGAWWAAGTIGELFTDKDAWVTVYDGAGWTTLATQPNGAYTYDELHGLAIVGDVWAVGTSYEFDYDDSFGEALAAYWDGATWHPTPLPDPGTNMHVLEEVAGAAPDDVWAVGVAEDRSSDPASEAVAHHWDGAAWSRVALPRTGDWSALRSIAVIAPDDAWAVGLQGDSNGEQQTSQHGYVVHWDGTAWTEVPFPSARVTQLRAVSASGPDDVWIVGDAFRGTGDHGAYAPLTAHWDGAAWRLVRAPLAGDFEHHLEDVVALSPDRAVAVGYFVEPFVEPNYQSLVLHWDGAAWRGARSANPYDYRNELHGVDVRDGQAVAVGIGTTIAADADPALVLAP